MRTSRSAEGKVWKLRRLGRPEDIVGPGVYSECVLSVADCGEILTTRRSGEEEKKVIKEPLRPSVSIIHERSFRRLGIALICAALAAGLTTQVEETGAHTK